MRQCKIAMWSRLHSKNGYHAPIRSKLFKNLFSPEPILTQDFVWYQHCGCGLYSVCLTSYFRSTSIYFTTRSNVFLNVFIWKDDCS